MGNFKHEHRETVFPIDGHDIDSVYIRLWPEQD